MEWKSSRSNKKIHKQAWQWEHGSRESSVEIAGRHRHSYWKPCLRLFHPRTFWGWHWKCARVTVLCFRLLVRWGDALLLVRLVVLTTSLGSLVLEKGNYLIIAQRGFRPSFGRSVPQTWSKKQPLFSAQAQISWRHGNEMNFPTHQWLQKGVKPQFQNTLQNNTHSFLWKTTQAFCQRC